VKFPNGYGASIICTDHSDGGPEGLFEVAVMKGDKFCYDSPISKDGIGRCDFGRVSWILKDIAALPKG